MHGAVTAVAAAVATVSDVAADAAVIYATNQRCGFGRKTTISLSSNSLIPQRSLNIPSWPNASKF